MTVYRIYYKDKKQETGWYNIFEDLNEALKFLDEIINKFEKVTFKKEEEEDE